MDLLNKNGTQCRQSAVRRIVLCCALFCALKPSLLAQNLVPNPSFELIDSCPQFPALTGYQPGAVPEYWYSTSDTPDYFNACVDTATGVPSNFITYQPAIDGNAYSGMGSVAGPYREMAGVELVNPLVVGQTYYASFYANAADGGNQPTGLRCNNIGLLFCMDPYYWVQGAPEFGLRNFAHVRSAAVISDTASWVLVSGSFVADSAYRFMVVGNHFDNANTIIDTLVAGNQYAYHLVDQFCVSPDPLGCPLASSVLEQQTDGYAVFPNPARDQIQITWNGQQVDRLRVTDVMGRTILQGATDSGESALLNVGVWARGLYILDFEGDVVRRSFKFVLVE